jgi:hypothetical protein
VTLKFLCGLMFFVGCGASSPVSYQPDAGPEVAAPCVPGTSGGCALCSTTGLIAKADGTPCDDGDTCTLDDRCQAGHCAAGKARDCDDGTPCTADSCDAVLGCRWLPLDVPCGDGAPCFPSAHCVAGECKPTAKDCDDHDVCTDDSCDVTAGACRHVNNGQEHCLPRFQVTSPAQALQTAAATVHVSGTVHSDAGGVTQVSIAGLVTQVGAGEGFQQDVPLHWGSQTVVLTATDATGGAGHALRAVRQSEQWLAIQAPGMVVPRSGSWRVGVQVSKMTKVPDLAPIWMVPRLFQQGAVTVTLAQAVTQVGDDPQAFDLAWLVTATAPVDAPSVGVPVRPACGPEAPVPPPGPQQRQWTATLDGLNALLWAQWRAGWFDLDAKELVSDVVPDLPGLTVQMRALMPPLLSDCAGPLRLYVDGLRYDATLPWGAKVLQATVWISLDAAVTLAVVQGELRVGIGQAEHVVIEVTTNNAGTDMQHGIETATRDSAVPKLVKAWAEAGVLRIPVGLAGEVTAVVGAVVVTE